MVILRNTNLRQIFAPTNVIDQFLFTPPFFEPEFLIRKRGRNTFDHPLTESAMHKPVGTAVTNWHSLVSQSSNMLSLWTKLMRSNVDQLSKTCESIIDFNINLCTLTTDTITQKDPEELNPISLTQSAAEYIVDGWQRSILFLDIMRQRGNHYIDHESTGQPPVLFFGYEMLIDGRTFERPVNYALVKIQAPKNAKIDESKRPYVIIDPRAGHGAGISGFKDESQVGTILKAGHQVYVVIFFPQPEPGQTLLDIGFAEEVFLRAVAQYHPNSPKPCVIGNCQGGWAAMALIAARPSIASVLVMNGAPLAYWAGENGKNPMRYLGGIMGGSWLARMTSDLGNGKFDGAHLVMNFELLNLGKSFWDKYYQLFAHIDNEEQRFLAFERWWGGYSLLNTNEILGIVNNLFIGNKLVHGRIPLGHSSNIDLRNVHVPIIIFCSQGDNITPPQQALNWITELYSDTLEIKLARQVIVYLIHENIGHLGIFVSSHIAKKEHKQIIDLMNYIEHLPAGLYEMFLEKEVSTVDTETTYSVVLKERSISDILAMNPNQNGGEDELFNIVQDISEMNSMLYSMVVSPQVRLFSNEQTGEISRQLHPLRMSRYLFSDLNPMLWPLAGMADMIRQHRQAVSAQNPFNRLQDKLANIILESFNSYREWRDTSAEWLFHAVYRTAAILLPADNYMRDIFHGAAAETQTNETAQNFLAIIEEGDIPEAVMRILLLLIKTQGFTRGKHVSTAAAILLKNNNFMKLSRKEFKDILHSQTIIVEYDAELALKTLPQLVKTQRKQKIVLDLVNSIIAAINIELPLENQLMMTRIENLFTKDLGKNATRSYPHPNLPPQAGEGTGWAG